MNRKPSTKREFCFVATNLSLNFGSAKDIKEMLDNRASYQVIPSVVDIFSGDVWQIILDILPFSQDTLLDICLPFTTDDKNRTVSHYSRFLMLGRKIIGIRIKTSQYWARYRCQTFRLPQEIIKYYNQAHQGSQIKNQCLIGEFYLSLHNMKIAPLFSSEIEENPEIIAEYERYGCDVFSVVDDILVDNIGDMHSVARKLLSRNDSRPLPIVFTGCKTSVNPVKCYWTNSFIVQGENKKQANLCPFADWVNIKLNIDTIEGLKYRDFPEISKIIQNYKEGDPLIKYVEEKTELMKYFNPFSKEIERKPVDYKVDSSLKKAILYLWFLFNKFNLKNPFTVGVPFTQTVMSMVCHLNDLRTMAKNFIPKDKPLLQIYRFNDERTSSFWPSNLQICNQSEFHLSPQSMIQAKRYGNLYIYCEYPEEMKYFKDKTADHSNIYVCKSLLVEKLMNDRRVDRNYLRKFDGSVMRSFANQNLEKLCYEILNKKYRTLEEMVKHFRSKSQSIDELVEAFTKIMPQKIRISMNLNPSYNFLLYIPKDRIEYELRQIQTNLHLKSSKDSKQMDEEGKEAVDLQSKLKEVAENKKATKIKFSTCHCCQLIVKKPLARLCDRCKNQICLECLSRRISNRNTEFSQFQKMIPSNCPFCNETCRCRNCIEKIQKKEKQQEERRRKIQVTYYDIRKCFQCQLLERKRKPIDIECESCHEVYCIQCLRIQEGLGKKFYLDNWNCSKCRNLFVLKREPINKALQIEQQKENQKNVKLLPHETAEGIRLQMENQRLAMQMVDEAKSKVDDKDKKNRDSSGSGSRTRKRKGKKDKRSRSGSRSSSKSSSSSSRSKKSRKKRPESRKSEGRDRKLQKKHSNSNEQYYKRETSFDEKRGRPAYEPYERRQKAPFREPYKPKGNYNNYNNYDRKNKRSEEKEVGLWNAAQESTIKKEPESKLILPKQDKTSNYEEYDY